MGWLTEAERKDLADALRDAGLTQAARRTLLFEGVHKGWVDSLPQDPAPLFQLLGDIQALDGQKKQLIDGQIPILIYLGNAVRLAEQLGQAELAAKIRPIRDRIASVIAGTPPPEIPLPDLAVKEVVVHTADFLSASFLDIGRQRSRAVARMEVPRVFDGQAKMIAPNKPERGFGTGWLIAPGLIFTCYHVIEARQAGEPAPNDTDWAAQAVGTHAHFDYLETGKDGVLRKVAEVISKDKGLDYALLRLETVDIDRSWFDNTSSNPQPRSANILQHPDGRPQEVSLRNNAVHKIVGNRLQYFTDTEHGSSGSPVCDDLWRVYAIHRAHQPAPANLIYQGSAVPYVNEGTLLDAIWNHLPQAVRARIDAARQGA